MHLRATVDKLGRSVPPDLVLGSQAGVHVGGALGASAVIEQAGFDALVAGQGHHLLDGGTGVPQVRGLLILSTARVLCPSLDFLLSHTRSRHWVTAIEACCDPAGFQRLRADADPGFWSSYGGSAALWQISILILTKGGGVADITVGDCVQLRQDEMKRGVKRPRRYEFYGMLHSAGFFPPGAPASLRGVAMFGGRLDIEALVDRYQLANREIRGLLVSYLAERQAALDYNTLDKLARSLVLLFWKNLELHHPGIDSLRLAPEVARAWKERVRSKVVRTRLADGTVVETTAPRNSYIPLLTLVRAFYLDLAQWATEDPARWARWAAPCPISAAELGSRKLDSHRKARMDQRTRERLPLLPALVATAQRRAEEARIRLEAALNSGQAESLTVLGETFTKPAGRGPYRVRRATRWIDSSGRERDLRLEANRFFWAWAAVEFLRHTGARIEEMLETSHHSITQYRVPATGELVPLLHIAPSKTDQERLLVINPELADVLSAIIARVRNQDGTVPLVQFYDTSERTWAAPAPLLFQWEHGHHARAISSGTIRRAIKEIFEATDLTDADGQPLYFQPHDLRRIFATEAILNGMPPHIAQILLGHKDISTTMGYKAVYPQEAINGHRAFIARRRTLRPGEEYRTPTDAEWDEFLGHFERRKVTLGECGRAYGTSCQHEHSCFSELLVGLVTCEKYCLRSFLFRGEQHVSLDLESGITQPGRHEVRLPTVDMDLHRVTAVALGLQLRLGADVEQ